MLKKMKEKPVLRFFVKLCTLIFAIWILLSFVIGFYRMNGMTMYPKISDGDLLVYYRLDSDYASSDVVTFKVNNSRRVARVVGVPGDTIELSEDGQLMVNGHVQDEEVFFETEPAANGIEYPYVVPEDAYFVLCDYRTISTDSRNYGAVKKQDIDGRIITVHRRRGI